MAGASAGNRVRKASRMKESSGSRSFGQRIRDGVSNVAGRVRRFFG